MAQQLLENRTPQAYAGVEAYAAQHAKDDAGALAWLVIGYARFLDKEYVSAREAWLHADPLEPVLGDYLDLLRASAFQGEQNSAEVIKALENFDQRYPDSLNQHDAAMLYAGALASSGEPQKAAAYLEKHRQPVRADLELALAKAYEGAGEKEKAQQILRRLYFEMPASPEADAAVQELRTLGEAQPVGSFEQRRTRSELLLKARRFQDAVSELSPLVELSPPDKMVSMQAQFGTALYKTRKRDDAYRLFENIAKNESASVEARAQALYFLAEISRDRDDHTKQAAYLIQLRDLAPDSNWLQEALLSAGNMYMLRNEFESAIPFYTEIYQRQRNGRFSPFTHWRAAWLSYRLGKKEDAKRLFEEQLEMYPSSSEVPAAIYWRGRLAEEEGNKPLARAYYQKLAENFRYFYYAYRGHARMEAMGGDEVVDPAPLDKLPPPVALPRNWDAPEDNLRLKKAQLLANGALYDFAVKEMQAAASGTPPWLAKAISEMYMGQGSYIHSIETLKRTVPGYFSAEIPQIPRPVWEGLFPRPFWDELKRNSEQNHLDPYLVASLIRQESEFNPAAVSSANALGLMQLLPSVGRGVAREMRVRLSSSDDLLTANTNLQLGTRYFKHMVDHYDGQVEYALAAYNAGEDRVDDWRRNGKFKDMDEFVESIPFTQTRDYVQAIMRNAAMYKMLYPKD